MPEFHDAIGMSSVLMHVYDIILDENRPIGFAPLRDADSADPWTINLVSKV